MDQAAQNPAFTIEQFTALWTSSQTRQYLSKMEIVQIESAINGKNFEIMARLYDIFSREQASYAQINQELTDNIMEILRVFKEETLTNGKKNFQEMVVKEEEREHADADQVLNNL